MSRAKPAVALLVIYAALLLAAGCANQTPLAKVDTARQTYVATLRVLTPFIRSGLIAKDEATRRVLYEARKEVASGLDAAESKALAGDKIGATFALDRVNGYLDKLLAAKLEGQRAVKPAAADPWAAPAPAPAP